MCSREQGYPGVSEWEGSSGSSSKISQGRSDIWDRRLRIQGNHNCAWAVQGPLGFIHSVIVSSKRVCQVVWS